LTSKETPLYYYYSKIVIYVMNDTAILNSFSLEFNSGIPVYRQIMNQICALINSCILNEGDQLPTIRSLTDALNVNPNTVAKAFRELELRGVISSQRGRGSYITSNANVNALAEEEKEVKIKELYSKMLAEAKSFGISEGEVKIFIEKGK